MTAKVRQEYFDLVENELVVEVCDELNVEIDVETEQEESEALPEKQINRN